MIQTNQMLTQFIGGHLCSKAEQMRFLGKTKNALFVPFFALEKRKTCSKCRTFYFNIICSLYGNNEKIILYLISREEHHRTKNIKNALGASRQRRFMRAFEGMVP